MKVFTTGTLIQVLEVAIYKQTEIHVQTQGVMWSWGCLVSNWKKDKPGYHCYSVNMCLCKYQYIYWNFICILSWHQYPFGQSTSNSESLKVCWKLRMFKFLTVTVVREMLTFAMSLSIQSLHWAFVCFFYMYDNKMNFVMHMMN